MQSCPQMPPDVYDTTGFFWISPLLTLSLLAFLLANVSPQTLPSPAFLPLTNAQGLRALISFHSWRKLIEPASLEALLFQECSHNAQCSKVAILSSYEWVALWISDVSLVGMGRFTYKAIFGWRKPSPDGSRLLKESTPFFPLPRPSPKESFSMLWTKEGLGLKQPEIICKTDSWGLF